MQKNTSKVSVKPSTAGNLKPTVKAVVPATTATPTAVAVVASQADNSDKNVAKLAANKPAPALANKTPIAASSNSNATNAKAQTLNPDKASSAQTTVASLETISPSINASVAKPASNIKANKSIKTTAPTVASTDKKTKKEKIVSGTKTEKAEKPKKPKLIRDSFTFPKEEYEQLASLKARVLKMGVASKKTEILRAAIQNLSLLSDAQLLAAIHKVPNIKTGRPAA